jgi:hypothetical protein
MRLMSGLLLAAASIVTLTATVAPASATCRKMGFIVNDFGLDGPTADAKRLLDRDIAAFVASQGITNHTVTNRDVKCEVYIAILDEHTCKATASVCWDEKNPNAKPATTAADGGAVAAPAEKTDKKAEKKEPAKKEPAKKVAKPAAAKPDAEKTAAKPDAATAKTPDVSTGAIPETKPAIKPEAQAPAAIPPAVEDPAKAAAAAAERAAVAAERAAAAAERAAAAAAASASPAPAPPAATAAPDPAAVATSPATPTAPSAAKAAATAADAAASATSTPAATGLSATDAAAAIKEAVVEPIKVSPAAKP